MFVAKPKSSTNSNTGSYVQLSLTANNTIVPDSVDILIIDQIIKLPSSTLIQVPLVKTNYGAYIASGTVGPYTSYKPIYELGSAYTSSYYDDEFEIDWLARARRIKDTRDDFLNEVMYDEYQILLKYMKVEGGKIRIVKDKAERDSNDISKDSSHVNELKSDFIEDNILTEKVMERILTKFVENNKTKWYRLSEPNCVPVVNQVIARYVKERLKMMMGTSQ